VVDTGLLAFNSRTASTARCFVGPRSNSCTPSNARTGPRISKRFSATPPR
jgi:hypothetical protein